MPYKCSLTFWGSRTEQEHLPCTLWLNYHVRYHSPCLSWAKESLLGCINKSGVLDSFLNLEGAGAGGRATLFRSTDAEVTKYYKKAKRPFGTIVSGDGFKAGLIRYKIRSHKHRSGINEPVPHLCRSATDYSVFVENLGMRGLDVAFYQPRSRYHTTEDDARHCRFPPQRNCAPK